MKELQKRIGENDQLIGMKVSQKEEARKRQQVATANEDGVAWEIEWKIQDKLRREIEDLEKQNKVMEQALAILVGIDNWEEVR